MSELVPADDGTIETASLVMKVIELASNPNTNPDMFDRLVAWQEREQARQAEEAFNAAMNLAQAAIQPVVRKTENSQTRSFYAKLESVDEAIRPIYLRHGFSVAYNTVPPLVPGNIRIECEVSHGRHSKKYYREAPPDTVGPQGKAVKTLLHGGGSTETYLKRYAVCGAFNVVFANQDDDGVRGGQEFISGEQCREFEELIKGTGRDRRRFLDVYGLRDVTEIEVGQYTILKNVLLQAQRKPTEPS